MQQQNFHVIGARDIAHILSEHHVSVMDLIQQTYEMHARRETINPDSYFLRFPEKEESRIIALPAYVGDHCNVAGIKWISSFPNNISKNISRASAAIILNSYETGHPFACLEGSLISASRTAASAALAARYLHPQPLETQSVAVIGTGLIAAKIIEFLMKTGWRIGQFVLFDLDKVRAEKFGDSLKDAHGVGFRIMNSAEDAIRESEMVVFATTSAKPYLNDPAIFTPEKTILHISLRDLGTDVILAGQNFVDDTEHCMKANTSTHLTEQKTGNRDFIAGTVADLTSGGHKIDVTRPRIFSPFGLGVLDIALAKFVYDRAIGENSAISIDEFFYGT